MTPKLAPGVADAPPQSETLTDYDLEHLVLYLRLLDAERDGADWREAAAAILGRDPTAEPELCRRCWERHLARAQWMTTTGYRGLLAIDRP